MPRGLGSVLVATGVISTVTAVTRLEQVPVRELAATPESVADGRLWLLATSAALADRPAFASVLGFLIVGVATVWLCGPRVVWIAAATGHVLSAALVYLGIGFLRLVDPTVFESVLRLPDYGTSAIIAAWIGALATVIWTRRTRVGAVAFCIAAALLGWYFKGTLTVLDSEHAVALVFGVAAMRYANVPFPRELRLRQRAARLGSMSHTPASSTPTSPP